MGTHFPITKEQLNATHSRQNYMYRWGERATDNRGWSKNFNQREKCFDICPLVFAWVSVLLGYCDKIPWTKWLINNRTTELFLTIPEAGSPRCRRCWLIQCLVRAASGFINDHLVPGPFPGGRVEGSSIRVWVPFMRAPLPQPSCLPKAPPPHTPSLCT